MNLIENKVPMRPDTYSLSKIDQWADREGGRFGERIGWESRGEREGREERIGGWGEGRGGGLSGLIS